MDKSSITAKKQFCDKAITVLKIVFFVYLLTAIIGMIYFSSKDDSNPIKSEDPMYIEQWNVTDSDGNSYVKSRSYVTEGADEKTYTLVSTLPDGISDNSNLCFVTGKDVSVYIGGELRKDFFGERDIIIPGGCVKRFYMLVPVNSEDSGKEIKIIKYGTTRRGQIYSDTFIISDRGLFSYLKSNYGLSLMMAEMLAVFSILVVILSIAMMIMYRQKMNLFYGALAVFVIAEWTITNSFIYPFIYGHYHIDGIFNYLYCLLMPFCLVFYIDNLQKGRYRKYMIGILCFASVNFLVWPILHVLRIFSLSYALVYINMALGLMIVVMMAIIIIDAISGKTREYRHTAIGFTGLLICGLAELVLLNFFITTHDDIPMLIGLMFLLIMSVIQQVYDLRKILDEKQKAMALSEAKTKFLASMSHEIRTPINAILGMNEMIMKDNKDPQIDEYAQNLKASGKMLLMLVNDVLDFSKIEAGKMEILHEKYYMSNLLKDILPMLKSRSDEKDLMLSVVLKSDIPNGQISDEFRIRQVLINLINNAIKYTDAGSVTLFIDGKYLSEDTFDLKMNVVDTGRGIREQDQKDLFEAFTRADISKNSNIEGTGLGLAIVKSIVDSMGGKITVESTYGKGSDFCVELPVDVFDKEVMSDDLSAHFEESDESKKGPSFLAPDASVLAVDDNKTNLKIVKLFLERIGIKPDVCENGNDAIECCKNRKYDLIFLDHMMPDPDGIETLRIIREDAGSKNKDTTAIVLTANAVAGSRQTYIDAGFADYLTKPIYSSVLEETVKKYLPDELIKEENI